ncbi:MAG: hypothetical protein ACRCXT_16600 [Paraclostridium sp.]
MMDNNNIEKINIKFDIDEFRLDNFISYYEENIEELLADYEDVDKSIAFVDKDYMDVFNSDEDAKEALLDEEYSLLFVLAKTYSENEKLEFIDGRKYNLTYYNGDAYESKLTIKDIGDLNLDLDHFVGVLFDYEDGELEISIVNCEHGDGIGRASINTVEDAGDLEEIIVEFLERFKN